MCIKTLQEFREYFKNILVVFFKKKFPKEEKITYQMILFVILITALFIQVSYEGSCALQIIKLLLLLAFFAITLFLFVGFVEYCYKSFNKSKELHNNKPLYGFTCIVFIVFFFLFLIALGGFTVELLKGNVIPCLGAILKQLL